MDEKSLRREVDRFILDLIDGVPHLEALLLLWNSRPKHWSIDELAHALYISNDRTREIVLGLQQREMVVVESQQCFYNTEYSRDTLISEVDRTYRRELVRISTMIHSKASPSVREFARAFRFKKD